MRMPAAGTSQDRYEWSGELPPETRPRAGAPDREHEHLETSPRD